MNIREQKIKSILRSVLVENEVGRRIQRFRRAFSYYTDNLFKVLRWANLHTEFSNYYYDLEDSNLEDLIHMISVVTNEDVSKIREYAGEIKQDLEIQKRLTEFRNSDSSLRDSELLIGRRVGWYILVRILKPKTVVETGIHHGMGGLVLIRALEMNAKEGFIGHYFGTDINPESGSMFKDKLGETHQILLGDSVESLRKFNSQIDFFINDSDHSSDYEYLEYLTISKLLSKDSIIIGDNSHVSGSLRKFSDETGRKFLFFKEKPKNHWYPGAGIGISFQI